MAEEKGEGKSAGQPQQQQQANQVSDETGQFDVRFMLWRTFCAEHNVPVDTLPGDLKGEARDIWDEMKDRQLHKPVEEGTQGDSDPTTTG